MEMDTLDQENHYIAELARLSTTSVSITTRIVEIQLAMVLRDLGVKGESQTPIGKFKLKSDGTLVIEHPNVQITRMLESKFLVEKILREAI
jgi:hypothetical protein